MNKTLIFTLIILLFLSCKSATKEVDNITNKDTIAVVQNKLTKSVFLSEDARKELLGQKYFEEFEKTIEQFYNATPEEIMLNANDLSEICLKLKDSITIFQIDRPDVKARFNILYNESLRLHDMSTISAISNDEVNSKIENIIYAYESIIAKINQVFLMKLNEENVDVQFQAPKVLDTTAKQVKKTEKDLKLIKKQ